MRAKAILEILPNTEPKYVATTTTTPRVTSAGPDIGTTMNGVATYIDVTG